jgi:hypothetical protein
MVGSGDEIGDIRREPGIREFALARTDARESKRRTAMRWAASACAMRFAARLSLPQVKQWANNA